MPTPDDGAAVSGDHGWVRQLARFVAPHRRKVAVALAAAFVGTGIAALTPLVQKVIVDDVILSDQRPLAPWLALLLAAGVVRFAASFVRRFVGGRVSFDVQHDLRTSIYRHLQRLDFASHDRLQTGQLVSRASTDVGLIQGILSFLPIVIGNFLLFGVSLVVMVFLSPLLTLVALAVAPLLGLVALRMRHKVFPASWDSQQQAGVVAGVVDEAVVGVRVVKGFGQEQRELGKLTDATKGLFARRLRMIRIQSRYQPTLQTIPVLGQVAILALGGWLVIEGNISLGTFLAFSTYLGQLTAPVRMLAGLLAVAQTARAGVERITGLLEVPPEILDRPGAQPFVPPDDRIGLEVRFEHVSFAYGRPGAARADTPVLDDFDLTVRPGETVALVGAAGSGKSTAALLVPRFYDPTGGAVRIEGVDVRDVTLPSLRSLIGVVFEDSFLFSDSVRSNIAYGRPDATDEDVEVAARAADAHDFITALPQGYDTVVGEMGLTLSGGQRQRVALARALLSDPRVLLLDDATSAIDVGTEEAIHDELRRLLPGRTTLVVARRHSTLRLADRICVLEGGRLLDSGTHDELQARCSAYRQLLSGLDDELEEGVAAPTRPVVTLEELPDPAAVPAAAVASSGNGSGRRGPGAGGAVGAGPWGGDVLASMAATPELLAQVQALPPALDEPHVDGAWAAAPDPRFSLRRVLRPFRWALLAGLVLVLVDAVATVAGPAILRFGIDEGVTPGMVSVLLAAAGVLLLVTLADWVVLMAQALVTGRTAERLLYSLRLKIFAQLQRLGLDYYERELAGRIMTRMTSDVDALAQLFQTGLVTALVALATFVGVGIALLVMNATLALATMSVLPPLVLATIWFRSRSARAYDRARDRIAVVNADLQEGLSGVRVTQAFAREPVNQTRFERVSHHYLEARLDAQKLVALYFPFVEFVSEVATVIVLGVGAALIANNALTAGVLIAFLLYVDQFFSPVQQLSQVFDSYQQARIALGRIGELLRTPTSTAEPADPVPLPAGGRLAGSVHFEHVTFGYGGSEEAPALVDLDLRIEPGETVAFVGATGAGKSTLVKLVARFYDPTAGRVLVDGLDLRDVDLAAYRHQLGIVPQEPFLFTGTLADNIAYGRPDASRGEVEAAARMTGANELVESLPGGYDHVLGERGRSLSAGQRQLVAMARAALVDPAILILDEATSQLDLATEGRVARAMDAVAARRTTLVVAHRLTTAARADRIVVLAGGRVVEIGTHRELVDEGGRYATAWSAFRDTSVTGRAPATTLHPSGSNPGPDDRSAEGKGGPPAESSGDPTDPARLASR